MKSVLIILIAIILLISITGTVQNGSDNSMNNTSSILEDTNFILNSDLERGTTVPLNWTFVDQGGNTPAWDSVSHSGSRSIKISIPGTTNNISGYPQSDIIDAQPLTTYKASVWGKTQNAGGANTPDVRVVELDENKTWIRQTNIPAFARGTNDWTQKTIEFQTHSNTRYLYLNANIWNGYGNFWLDDAELRMNDAPTPNVTDEFMNGDWKTNWVIDSPAANLIPTDYTENGKSDLILFTLPIGAQSDEDGTNKIMTKGGDILSYGTYEARFKLADVDFQNNKTGVYVGMGLWNFNGPKQQEVMMGFFYEPGENDYIEILTTKNRARDDSNDPDNKHHSKIVDPDVVLENFSGKFRTIKLVYEPGKVSGYLDDNLILTKTDLIPSEPMTLVIGTRVTGGRLSSNLKVIWDYVKITYEVPPLKKNFDVYFIGGTKNPNGLVIMKNVINGIYTLDDVSQLVREKLRKMKS
ncbi:MAG: hypothetical protein C3F06_12240 [Candidatus Methanoperedenaceae archaeon]|nr:MAG: hypothetical protein C3F06_12240 [Candidatus Methanoperedenaceae archaeon]